jgi:hypothetical protein
MWQPNSLLWGALRRDNVNNCAYNLYAVGSREGTDKMNILGLMLLTNSLDRSLGYLMLGIQGMTHHYPYQY